MSLHASNELNNFGELQVTHPESPEHCSVYFIKTPKQSVSSSQQDDECSSSDDDVASTSFCDSKGDLTEVEELEDEWNCTFSTRSDSAIDLSVLSLDRTSSMASRKHPSRGCRCKCHAGRPLKRNASGLKRPLQKPLNVSISLPVYTNGSYTDPRDIQGNTPWFVSFEPPRPVAYDAVEEANTNSNNNHSGLADGKSTSSSKNNDVAANQTAAKQTTQTSSKTESARSKKSFITNQNKCLCILIAFLAAFTVVTVAALVYFVAFSKHLQGVVSALNPDSHTKQPPPSVVPKANDTLNQTFECGTIPSFYLPSGVDYSSPFFASIKPGSVGPFNDTRTTVSPRIIQGEAANIAQYPWQSALFHETRGFLCGGSVILSKWLLTATHCIEIDNDITKWTAYFGLSVLSRRHAGEGESRRIVSYISNPNYFTDLEFAYDYDITLLELESDLPYTKFIQPICVPPQSYAFPDGMECYISGWGLTNNEGRLPHPDILQHAQVDVISNETCNRPDWYGGLVTDRMLCAGKSEGGRDSCQGDSGGPLSCYIADKDVWMVAGIVSWGIGCGLPKFPGVYTKLSFFTDWVWNKIGQAEGLLPPDPEEPEVEEPNNMEAEEEPTDGEWIPDNMEYPGFYGYDSAALTDESMNSTDF